MSVLRGLKLKARIGTGPEFSFYDLVWKLPDDFPNVATRVAETCKPLLIRLMWVRRESACSEISQLLHHGSREEALVTEIERPVTGQEATLQAIGYSPFIKQVLKKLHGIRSNHVVKPFSFSKQTSFLAAPHYDIMRIRLCKQLLKYIFFGISARGQDTYGLCNIQYNKKSLDRVQNIV